MEDKEERYALTDIVYKTTGAMSWKFGVDASHSLQNVIPLFAALGGHMPFSRRRPTPLAPRRGTGGRRSPAYLLGVVNGNVTLRNTRFRTTTAGMRSPASCRTIGKSSANLTLNLGVRYNVQMPRTEKYDNQGVFRPDLAQSMPLATPLTLQDGEVINSVLVPPFAFSGRGGNSRYLTPTDYKDFEPRFGFAWSPRSCSRTM